MMAAGVVVLASIPWSGPALAAAAARCVQAGALVFGGGHVVLPLIEQPFTSAGWVDREAVMSGYALAQAMPGPLFTLASYLGAAMGEPGGAPSAFLGAAPAGRARRGELRGDRPACRGARAGRAAGRCW